MALVNMTTLPRIWHETGSVMKLTSLTSTSLCPLAACWLSLSWLCSFTTSWAAFRRWSSATSSSASNRFTLCSNSRDRSSGMPPSESFNERTLVFNSRFSSWSLATYQERNWSYFPTNRFGEMTTQISYYLELFCTMKKKLVIRIFTWDEVEPKYHGGKTKRAEWAWYRSHIRSMTWYGKISGLQTRLLIG